MSEEVKSEEVKKDSEPTAEAAASESAAAVSESVAEEQPTAAEASVEAEKPVEEAKPAESEKSDESDNSAEEAKAAEAEKSAEAEKPAAEEKPVAEEKPSEPDWKTLYALSLADFDNYKKRAARDRDDTYRYAEADILGDILPTVDNLSLALNNAKDKENDFVKGVQLVYDALLAALKKHQAEPFDCIGKDLDTDTMEAIATLPHPEIPEGKVSIESKRGWMLKGKVLRAAQVVVSSGKPQ